MAEINIVFRGLCTFVSEANGERALLLDPTPHHGSTERHQPVLVIQVDCIDIESPWKPDHVGYDTRGNQIGIWSLNALDPTFTFTPVSAGLPSWINRSEAIDLIYWHRRDNLSRKFPYPGSTKITIAGGKLICEDFAQFTVTHPGTRETTTRDFARAIRWNVNATSLAISKANNPAESIDVKPDSTLLITNVAKVAPTNLADHFKHYYEIFNNPGTNKLTVEHQDITVFDCVPPTPGP